MKQKTKETIPIFLWLKALEILIVMAMIFVPVLIGKLSCSFEGISGELCRVGGAGYWLAGLLCLVFLPSALIIIWMIVDVNWEKAKRILKERKKKEKNKKK